MVQGSIGALPSVVPLPAVAGQNVPGRSALALVSVYTCVLCGFITTLLPDQGSFTVHGSKGMLPTLAAAGLCTGFGAVVFEMGICGGSCIVCAPVGFPSSVGSAWRSGMSLPVEEAGGITAQFLIG